MPFIGQEVLDGGEQKPAEFPLLAIQRAQIVLRQQAREEFLREILGFLGAASALSDIAVKGVPIGLAEALHRLIGSGVGGVASVENDAPVGRAKDRGRRWVGSWVHVGVGCGGVYRGERFPTSGLDRRAYSRFGCFTHRVGLLYASGRPIAALARLPTRGLTA